MEALRVVCVGGGLGSPTVTAGLRAYTDDITGLIAVTDSGRSTGKVRIALDVRVARAGVTALMALLDDRRPALRALS